MAVTNRLRQIREERGLPVAALARAAGVTRQTIYSIEDGAFVPNTAVSLQLARVLAVTVEELFSIAEQRPEVIEVLPSGTPNSSLVRLCKVQERFIAVAASYPSAYIPAADGTARDLPSAAAAAAENRFVIAGCDPALSLLEHALSRYSVELIMVPCSSRQALAWLKQGRVHAAGSHLLDDETGEYNLPMVRHLFPRRSVQVITFAEWEQGLVVQRGNPKSIRAIEDLAGRGISIVNREKGSGSRDLLDRGLRKVRLAAKRIGGYETIAATHLEAAHAVAAGTADGCIAARAAARCFDLDFIPLAAERFDLSIASNALQTAPGRAVANALNSSALRNQLQAVAGHEAANTGRVLF